MSKIKCFIFDQDGTLYPEKSKLTKIIREKTKRWIINRLSINKNEIDKIYGRLPLIYPNALEGFQSLGLSIRDYHKNVFDTVNPCKYLAKDKKLVSTLKKLKGKKFVVTFSSKEYSQNLQKTLGVTNLIEKTYCSIDFLPKTSKLSIYEQIRKENGLKKDEVLIVGNNLQVDIVPASNNGYPTVLVGDSLKQEISEQIIKISNISDLIDEIRKKFK